MRAFDGLLTPTPARRRAIAGTSVVLLAVVFGLSLVLDGPDEPAAVVYAVPVALFAIVGGPLYGALAGAVGAALFWIADAVKDAELEPGAAGYRAIALIVMGLVCGALADRVVRAEASLTQEAERRAQAVELNDEVVQGLALSGYLLREGRQEEAAEAIDTTLERSKSIVAGLIGRGGVEPGALRRGGPADEA